MQYGYHAAANEASTNGCITHKIDSTRERRLIILDAPTGGQRSPTDQQKVRERKKIPNKPINFSTKIPSDFQDPTFVVVFHLNQKCKKIRNFLRT
jgi:hypothetical protein